MKEKLSKVAVIVQPADNVATAVKELEPGTELVHGKMMVNLRGAIKAGHKFALQDIPKGNEIIKYGEVIGSATSDIAAGEWVHVHNIEGRRGRGDIRKPVN